MLKWRMGVLLSVVALIALPLPVMAAETAALTQVGQYIPVAMLSALGVVMALICLDALMGIVAALKSKTFNIRKLPQFLTTNLLPYVAGLLVLLPLALLVSDLAAVYYAAAAAVAAKYVAEVKDKIAAVFGEAVAAADGSTTAEDMAYLDKLQAVFTGFNEQFAATIEKLMTDKTVATQDSDAAAETAAAGNVT